ncbi:MAG: hypothetical protein M5R36_29920 [Deltaproteobacteria bacterium]|nr:hypothetical protein [Deltaproteobacteria bacterium]
MIADIAVRRIEQIPNLVLRNEGKSHAAMPYLFGQIRRTRGEPAVAFLGSSVMQGVFNTTPETAAPPVVERLLRDRGVSARCFNLAVIGNCPGDNFALANEAARRGAGLLVFPLHLKLFSNEGSWPSCCDTRRRRTT